MTGGRLFSIQISPANEGTRENLPHFLSLRYRFQALAAFCKRKWKLALTELKYYQKFLLAVCLTNPFLRGTIELTRSLPQKPTLYRHYSNRISNFKSGLR